jgi:hypothetical protein
MRYNTVVIGFYQVCYSEVLRKATYCRAGGAARRRTRNPRELELGELDRAHVGAW